MKSLWICVVLFLLGSVWNLTECLNPRDLNVCSLWESFTTSVKESYAQPFDQVYEEPCSELWSSNKCVRHRITYKTAYRQSVKMDYRRRYQCCPGFYESRNKCVPRCTKECVHGRCVAPDRCQCEGGWRGDDCSSSCDDLHWGPGCSKECQCQNKGQCDVLTGSCICPPGYTGTHCQNPCPKEYFGPGCAQQCQCGTGGSCNKETGECVCREGFTGTLCDTPCVRTGRCAARCSCHNGGICQGKGVCLCPPGWTGLVCTEPCPKGRFGINCSRECLCHNGGHCDPEKGHCQCAPGFTGERCNEECAVGTYGQDCKGVCDCTNAARCYHIDGGCLCEPGFRGPQCSHRMCTDGTFGMHALCHPLKGECTCQPGWAGLYCNETCAHGYYGNGCLESCLCVNGGVCDTVTGVCQCAPGYTGGVVQTVPFHVLRGPGARAVMPHASVLTRLSATQLMAPVNAHLDGEGICVTNPALWGTLAQAASINVTVSMMKVATVLQDSATVCQAGRVHDAQSYVHKDNGAISVIRAARASTAPPAYHTMAFACVSLATGDCSVSMGYTGPLCEQVCKAGTFGTNCNQMCSCPPNHSCDPHTGACLCEPGPGVDCAQERVVSMMVPVSPVEKDSWGAIVGIVVLLILVVLLLALLLIYYRRRQKDKQSNTPTVSFSSTRNVTSEYAVPDVPHSYHHYYSNPSYHTLSQNRLPLPQIPNNQDRVIKNTNKQLFYSLKNMERERRGLFGMETNATLPADWKHQEPPKDQGSYSYSASFGKYYNKQLKDSCIAVSNSSLNSENPYATIKDLPGLPPCTPECSYMEMKPAVPPERSYTELRHPALPSTSFSCREQCPLGNVPEQDPQNHYDLPVNSHIPGHYDLPPVRRPPSPSPCRQAH
ncbi:Multiple epidermal growth factor-like domains protein 10 [Bagarius yarrelli]|uniref:Multiple epidermal growth factor-like domains protein 10 n=1 Tax=Bagarius yarrelli TaxID=175774 RepID=A0A556TQ19_BAGYA|nr:Multiple epidermal growth factor-like domains protein 10 [Bagarius yarrelli]